MIDAGSSSYPEVEFVIADMIVNISPVYIFGMCKELAVLLIL